MAQTWRLDISLTISITGLEALRRFAKWTVEDEAQEYGWLEEHLIHTRNQIDADDDAAIFFGCRNLSYRLAEHVPGIEVLGSTAQVVPAWPGREELVPPID